jgi:predicted metal-dependent enzyme (double-stranded beta helix superfamily)
MMNSGTYSIRELADDIEAVCSRHEAERDILSAVRPLMRRAALASASWLDDRLYAADREQGFGVHLLHEKPDHTLAIFVVSWLPHRGAPPHDHGTWAVIAGVDGPEKNEFFERIDDRSREGYAELRKVGEKVCAVGDVIAMPKGTIHSVVNETETTSLSLHVYGKHVNYTGRSRFDIERHTETPFIVTLEAGGEA